MFGLIGTLITGTIIGFGGRAILPGGQDIGLPKTVLVGVISAFIGGLVFSGTGTIMTIILGSLIAAGALWLAIRQGWLKPDPNSTSRL